MRKCERATWSQFGQGYVRVVCTRVRTALSCKERINWSKAGTKKTGRERWNMVLGYTTGIDNKNTMLKRPSLSLLFPTERHSLSCVQNTRCPLGDCLMGKEVCRYLLAIDGASTFVVLTMAMYVPCPATQLVQDQMPGIA